MFLLEIQENTSVHKMYQFADSDEAKWINTNIRESHSSGHSFAFYTSFWISKNINEPPEVEKTNRQAAGGIALGPGRRSIGILATWSSEVQNETLDEMMRIGVKSWHNYVEIYENL